MTVRDFSSWDDDLSLPTPSHKDETDEIQALVNKLSGNQPVPASPYSSTPSIASQQEEPFSTRSAFASYDSGASDDIDIEVKHVEEGEEAESIDIDDILTTMLEMGGSDLHLTAKKPPVTRINGDIEAMEVFPRLTGESIKNTLFAIMTRTQQNKFEEKWELDFAYTLPGVSRFRVNVLKQQDTVAAVFRAIPWDIRTFEQLGLPSTLEQFTEAPRGLVLVTGPTGSGKSTTLAAMIDRINRTKKKTIFTIEDPIEFAHEHQMSIVNQREIGRDTHTYADALKHVLRQDPDIILVGEMRDLETISVALSAAETGHLVFATLHTQSAQETITRIIDVFPDASKDHVRTQLAASIQGIVCQALLKRQDKPGRVAALEVLIGNNAIRNLIREGKLHQVQSAIQTAKSTGMQTLDKALEELVASGIVDPEEAASKSTNATNFINNLGGLAGIERLRTRHRIQANEGSVIYGGQ